MCYRDTGASPELCFVPSDVSWPWLLLPCYSCCHHRGGLCYACLLLLWAPPGSLAVLCTVLKWCSHATWTHCLQAFSLLCDSPWLGSRELHLGSAPGCCYLWKLGNCAWKKLVEGALPTTRLLAVTCRARVCAVVFKGGVQLWKPASACPESV